MKCPNCKIEDKEENEHSYFNYFWNGNKFMFKCKHPEKERCDKCLECLNFPDFVKDIKRGNIKDE